MSMNGIAGLRPGQEDAVGFIQQRAPLMPPGTGPAPWGEREERALTALVVGDMTTLTECARQDPAIWARLEGRPPADASAFDWRWVVRSARQAVEEALCSAER